MDAEMVEAAAASTAASGQNDAVADLLALARRCINQRKPSQALQAVIIAMRTEGRLQENAAADQLASLFAECVIAEAQPVTTEPSTNNIVTSSISPDVHGTPILAETGRTQVVLDAMSDGSSFICLKCGGLVSNHRKDEHYAYWCC